MSIPSLTETYWLLGASVSLVSLVSPKPCIKGKDLSMLITRARRAEGEDVSLGSLGLGFPELTELTELTGFAKGSGKTEALARRTAMVQAVLEA